MQEHVELEVSLELIMAKISEKIFNLKENESLTELMDIQERAYKGERKVIQNILNGEI